MRCGWTGVTTMVSTHSRLKAAAGARGYGHCGFNGFNTQPPEGGCPSSLTILSACNVSTHSRLKAAALINVSRLRDYWFQHTAA